MRREFKIKLEDVEEAAGVALRSELELEDLVGERFAVAVTLSEDGSVLAQKTAVVEPSAPKHKERTADEKFKVKLSGDELEVGYRRSGLDERKRYRVRIQVDDAGAGQVLAVVEGDATLDVRAGGGGLV